MSLGLPPDRFWRASLRVVSAEMKGATQGLERDHKSRAWLAHTTAALTRFSGRKFPSLDDLTRKGAKASNADAMLATARRWHAALKR